MGKYRISTPASSAGILSFSDAKGGGGPQIEPMHVLAFALGIIFLVVVAGLIM